MPEQNKKRIPIMKVGKHTDNKGNVVEFSAADLKDIATFYNPKDHEAPLVIGHPKTDAPAYGWTHKLEFDEGANELVAFADINAPEFSEAIDKKFYKKISASFYPKDSPQNPVQGKAFGLRHIGFLGAVPPSIKGLGELRTADFSALDESVTFEFSEDKSDPASSDSTQEDRFKRLEERLAAAEARNDALEETNRKLIEAQKAKATAEATQANNDFAESLVTEGRLLPAHRSAVIALLNNTPEATLEFNEAEKSYAELLKDFLSAAPVVVDFSETATKDKAGESDPETFDYAEGTDPKAIELDQKIRAYMKAHNVSYTEAFSAVN